MSTITIYEVDGTELYHKYPGQSEAQPCFVELDARAGVLSAIKRPLTCGSPRRIALAKRPLRRDSTLKDASV